MRSDAKQGENSGIKGRLRLGTTKDSTTLTISTLLITLLTITGRTAIVAEHHIFAIGLLPHLRPLISRSVAY
jgi:hypothetical protein